MDDTEWQGRLDAIGPYEVEDHSRTWREYVWDRPSALNPAFPPFRLRFSITSRSDVRPDGRMLALWDAYAAKHPEHLGRYRAYLVELYRSTFGPPATPSRRWPSDLSEEKVLRDGDPPEVVIERIDDRKGRCEYQVSVVFRPEWAGDSAFGFEIGEGGEITGEIEE